MSACDTCWDKLPPTASGKVSKYALRDRGVGADTWDREEFGAEVER